MIKKHTRRHRSTPLLGVCALTAAVAFASRPAAAVEASISGFATVEYAQSNRDFAYLRFIDDQGTWKAGSLAAVQLDVQFNPQWSATVQLKAAPALGSDSSWDVKPSWAFIAWRPSDEWLLRLGKMRVPLYLYSESQDIGESYDMARLPREVYTLGPTTDFAGLFASWSTPLGADSELTIEAYTGSDSLRARVWTRDGVPPMLPPGSSFAKLDVRPSGLIATWRGPQTLLRAGLHDGRTEAPTAAGFALRYPFVSVAPGLGYYRVNPALPGPEIESVPSLRNSVLHLGAEQRFGDGWRVAGEYLHLWQHRSELGSAGRSGYLALFKEIGEFTPYVSLSGARADAEQMGWYRRLTTTQLPATFPGAGQINASQRLAAESLYLLNQDTLSLGSSYSLGEHGKLKLEWARTRLGDVSRLVDVPAGAPNPARSRIDVWTLSYSISF